VGNTRLAVSQWRLPFATGIFFLLCRFFFITRGHRDIKLIS
jgi:hypothetical protein